MTTRRTIFENDKCLVKCITSPNYCRCKCKCKPTPPTPPADTFNYFTNYGSTPYGNIDPTVPYIYRYQHPYCLGNNVDNLLTGSVVADNEDSGAFFISKINDDGTTASAIHAVVTTGTTKSLIGYSLNVDDDTDSIYVTGTLNDGNATIGGQMLSSVGTTSPFLTIVDKELTFSSFFQAFPAGRVYDSKVIERSYTTGPSPGNHLIVTGRDTTELVLYAVNLTSLGLGSWSPTTDPGPATDADTFTVIEQYAVDEVVLSGSHTKAISVGKVGGGNIVFGTATFTAASDLGLANTFIGRATVPQNLLAGNYGFYWMNEITRGDMYSGTNQFELAVDSQGNVYAGSLITGNVTYDTFVVDIGLDISSTLMKLDKDDGSVLWARRFTPSIGSEKYITSHPKILVDQNDNIIYATTLENSTGPLLVLDHNGDTINSIALSSDTDTVIMIFNSSGTLIDTQLVKTGGSSDLANANGENTPGTTDYRPFLDQPFPIDLTDDALVAAPIVTGETGYVNDNDQFIDGPDVGSQPTIGFFSYPY